jgi:hypothetical protein
VRLSILAAATVPTCRIRLCRPDTGAFTGHLADGAGHTFFRAGPILDVPRPDPHEFPTSAPLSGGRRLPLGSIRRADGAGSLHQPDVAGVLAPATSGEQGCVQRADSFSYTH